jgi:glycosyltransferase involved in cell wall biosynthesis
VTISACIIAYNEAELLPECLASVAFCDEIVLVDSGSTDDTVQIAIAAGARVVHQPWLGFAAQRNLALDHARGIWVLEIDADERVSPRLRGEIEAFLAAQPEGINLGGIPLREIFLTQPLGPSAKYPKYRHRLFRRGSYRHDEARTVHEGLVPHGPVHPFQEDLLHLFATSYREALGDAWRYARLEAGQLEAASTPWACLRGAVLRPSVKLLYRLTIDGGWRDGRRGLMKIVLDCLTDSIVWIRHLLGRRGNERGRSGVEDNVHYASRKFHRGCLRVVAVAASPLDVAHASEWLAVARASGADVALISDERMIQPGLHTRGLAHLGPLSLIRALDAEEQLRPIDAVLAFGTRARLLMRVVPSGMRGCMPHITRDTDPQTTNWAVRAQEDTAC